MLKGIFADAAGVIFDALDDIPQATILRRTVPTAYNPATGKTEQPSAKLDGAITADATTITIKTTAGTWVDVAGVIKIGTEQIFYKAKSGLTLTGCVRGYNSTTPASAADSAAVTLTSQDFPASGILGSYKQFEITGTSILATDRKLTLRQAEIPGAGTPTTSDKAVVGGKSLTIINVQQDAASVLWVLQVRG